jgi:hypothetical protein
MACLYHQCVKKISTGITSRYDTKDYVGKVSNDTAPLPITEQAQLN